MYTAGGEQRIFFKGANFFNIPPHHTEFFDSPASWPEDSPFRLKISSPSPRPPPVVYLMNAALVHSWLAEVHSNKVNSFDIINLDYFATVYISYTNKCFFG